MKKFYFLFLFALIASIGNLYAAEKTVTFDFSTNPGAVSGIKNGEITVLLIKAQGRHLLDGTQKMEERCVHMQKTL